MKKMRFAWLLPIAAALVLAGCQVNTTTSVKGPAPAVQAATTHGPDKATEGNADEEKDIQEELAKLSPGDRKLAEAQKFCVIQKNERLGSMGAPVKIMVKDQPVFLCCGNCKKDALKDPDKTLAELKGLKEKVAKEAKN